MKMIKTLFLTCFFVVTMSLTGCLTVEDAAESITPATGGFSDDGSISWGGGSWGGSTLGDIESFLGR